MNIRVALVSWLSIFVFIGCGEQFQTASDQDSRSKFDEQLSGPAPETIEGLYITFLSESTAKFRHHSGDDIVLNSLMAQASPLGPAVMLKVDGFEAVKAQGMSLVNALDGQEVQKGACAAETESTPASCSVVLTAVHFENYVCPNAGINRFFQPKAGTYEVRLHYADSYRRSVLVFPDPCNLDAKTVQASSREVASAQQGMDETSRYVSHLMSAAILGGLCLISFLLYRRSHRKS